MSQSWQNCRFRITCLTSDIWVLSLGEDLWTLVGYLVRLLVPIHPTSFVGGGGGCTQTPSQGATLTGLPQLVFENNLDAPTNSLYFTTQVLLLFGPSLEVMKVQVSYGQNICDQVWCQPTVCSIVGWISIFFDIHQFWFLAIGFDCRFIFILFQL